MNTKCLCGRKEAKACHASSLANKFGSILLALLLCSWVFGSDFALAKMWDWEDGTLQGWKSKLEFSLEGDTLNLTNTAEQAFHGSRSLKWHIKGSKQDGYWYIAVTNPEIQPGESAIYRVWVPSTAPINGLKTFMKDSQGNWVDGVWYAAGAFQNDFWSELTITAPATQALPFLELGLQVQTPAQPVDFVVYLDYVSTGQPSQPQNLTAQPVAGPAILLDWWDNTDADLAYYNVYRDTSSRFRISPTTFVDSTRESTYLDQGLELYKYYYYKVTAVDTAGNESLPSLEVSVYLSIPGIPPSVSIKRTNAQSVGLYEKFEVVLDLQDATFNNPYDYTEIDIQAVFTSPSGKEWRIFGFYDNYNNQSAWKVRFAPNEVGAWRYYVTATDVDGTGQSEERTFTAVTSARHGWIRVSEENPHYLVHDDGTPYYGIGPYTPWNLSIGQLNLLQQNGANFFAVWNIMYGGLIDGGIIEQELGRYNQVKCGEIDTVLEMASQRGLKMMFCIWPHDLFCKDLSGWAKQWPQNPYRFLCDVKDIYRDPVAWEYQKKQYRYLIARFGYSESFGVWEIINEINGTDAWQAGRQLEAIEWVRKVDEYLNQNDPFRRPTTASRSGDKSEYDPRLYEKCDMPNVHIYEQSNWGPAYPANLLRSSMKNFADAALRFWDNFTKPALFGEAGYTATYYPPNTPEYTAIYHNALWASLTNGLSVTPVWWTMSTLTSKELEQLRFLRRFAGEIDFIRESKEHYQFVTDEYDLFGMKGDSTAFGWIRDAYARRIGGLAFSLENILSESFAAYRIEYYNPWNGEFYTTHIRPYSQGRLLDIVPETPTAIPDVAFRIQPAEGGTTPAQLDLLTLKSTLLNYGGQTTEVLCYLMDAQGRFCSSATNQVNFSIAGGGTFVGESSVAAQNGVATVVYQAGLAPGLVKVIASSAGLQPDTLILHVTNRVVVDDMESYPSDVGLQTSWAVKAGSEAILSLETEPSKVGSGQYSMRLEYGIGGSYKTYVWLERALQENYPGAKYFSFWHKPDGSLRSVTLRIRDISLNYMDYKFELTGAEPGEKVIPLSDFVLKAGIDSLRMSRLKDLTIRIEKGAGADGRGTVYFDDFAFLTTYTPTAVETPVTTELPAAYQLSQNFPNPFNNATTIKYSLPRAGHVRIAVYNLVGQPVDTIIDQKQPAGNYSIRWEATNVPSGVYFYKIEIDDFVDIKRLTVVK